MQKVQATQATETPHKPHTMRIGFTDVNERQVFVDFPAMEVDLSPMNRAIKEMNLNSAQKSILYGAIDDAYGALMALSLTSRMERV